MNPIVRWFLRAKHWQIFLCFCVALVIGEVATIKSAFDSPTLRFSFRETLPFFSVLLVFTCFFLSWFWSMGSFLNSLLQPPLRRNIRFFGFSLVFPYLYTFIFIAVLLRSNPSLPALLILIALNLLAMFCLLYPFYFIAKSLVQAEAGKPATFYDYAGPFFLLWFFPVGVWFTQPRINRLYEQSANAPQKS
jgi:hypothetical protein